MICSGKMANRIARVSSSHDKRDTSEHMCRGSNCSCYPVFTASDLLILPILTCQYVSTKPRELNEWDTTGRV